jgi:hypothetical protein
VEWYRKWPGAINHSEADFTHLGAAAGEALLLEEEGTGIAGLAGVDAPEAGLKGFHY